MYQQHYSSTQEQVEDFHRRLAAMADYYRAAALAAATERLRQDLERPSSVPRRLASINGLLCAAARRLGGLLVLLPRRSERTVTSARTAAPLLSVSAEQADRVLVSVQRAVEEAIAGRLAQTEAIGQATTVEISAIAARAALSAITAATSLDQHGMGAEQETVRLLKAGRPDPQEHQEDHKEDPRDVERFA